MSDSPSTPPPESGDGDAAFERIDWERDADPGRRLTAERTALGLALIAVVALYAYYRSIDSVYLVWRWDVGRADWLLLLAAAVLVAYGVVPLVRRPRAARRLLGRLRRRPGTAASLGVLASVLGAAAYAVLSGFQPRLTLETGTGGPDRFQPPPGVSGPYMATRSDCVGRVVGETPFERECFGTWTYLLGTDRWGYELTDLLLVGARPVLYAVVVTFGLIVPLATAVGLVAGYYGGTVDDLLMAYVDVQLAVPAILLYLLAFVFVGNSLFLLLAAFGLLSWGAVARIVRSETLQRREEGYVRAARAAGVSDLAIVRGHVLPNVTNSVVPAGFHLAAVLVLTEAGLSFLGFHVSFQSWGMTVAEGVFYGSTLGTWWASAFPAVALALTVGALKVAGDGLRDVLDPRGHP